LSDSVSLLYGDVKEMKTLPIQFLSLLLASGIASANCGNNPTAPQDLAQAQLTIQQLEILKSELDSYFTEVDTYKFCIDQQVSQLAPADAPLEYFDSPEYQVQFEELESLLQNAESRKAATVERFNYLVEIASDQ